MKLRKSTFTALAAFAALALSTVASQAAITYNNGDIFLGFTTADGSNTNDFVVNLGSYTQFRDSTSPVVFTLSNINTTLSSGSLFGAGWATDPNVVFGLFGTNQNTATSGDAPRTLYISEPIGSTAPLTSFVQSSAANAIVGLKNYYSGPNGTATSVANSATTGASASNSFTSNSFTSFNDSGLAPLTNTVDGGLELYRLQQADGEPGQLLGTFSYTGGDSFTFTPTAVPEPSTAALGGLVILGLAFRRHRKSVLA